MEDTDLEILLTLYLVHRIGRTGRSGKTGIATTFINQHCSEQIRLDLKHLLREAKQKVPPFLAAMEDPSEKYGLSGGKKSMRATENDYINLIIRMYILWWSWSSYQ